MDAILSDNEANLEALQAVLDSAQQHNVDRIICLGDIVGYGPNPVECADLLRSCDVYIASEWDLAVASDSEPNWTGPILKKRAWVHKQFVPYPGLLKFLKSGKLIHTIGNKSYFHGTPLSPTEYLVPEDIYVPGKIQRIVDAASAISFCGNIHEPGIFLKDQEWNFLAPSQFNEPWITLNSNNVPCICLVGSVGQPRDGDPRASYVLNDGEQIRFMRVDYDYETTKRKILSNPNLDNNAGERLSFGR